MPTDPGFPQIIKKLIERKQAQIRKVYPGLSCFKEGVRQIPVESVPGIRELRGLGGVVGGEGHPLARSRQTISSLPSPPTHLPTLQEKQAGNQWGKRRGECGGPGRVLGRGEKLQGPEAPEVAPHSPQEGAEGP